MLVRNRITRRLGGLGDSGQGVEFRQQPDDRTAFAPFRDEGGRNVGNARPDRESFLLQFVDQQPAGARFEITQFRKLPYLLGHALGAFCLRFHLRDGVGGLRTHGRCDERRAGSEDGDRFHVFLPVAACLPQSAARANVCRMELPPALLQFLGSLAAIFALAGVAVWLKLGPAPRLADETEARIAAEEAVSGFEPVAIGLDRDGRGALLRDAAGRVLLLRPHGVHFAGRILSGAASVRRDGDMLVIDTAERRYGAARLALDDASAWVDAIEAVKS